MKKKKNIICVIFVVFFSLFALTAAQAQYYMDYMKEALNNYEQNNEGGSTFAQTTSETPPMPQEPEETSSDVGEIPDLTPPAESARKPLVPVQPENVILDVLELKDMDIQDFLKLIAKKSGLNIIAGSNVAGKVTIYLKEVDVRDALRIILGANNLAYKEENNIIKVMTAQEYALRYGHNFGAKTTTAIIKLSYANVLDMVTILNQMKSPTGKVIFDNKSNTLVLIDTPPKIEEMQMLIKKVDVPIETEVFDLNYAKAKEIGDKVKEVLTANVGRIKVDERSNRIVATDTQVKIDEIRKIIEAFDVKEKEVLIEAKILQIVLSNEHKMGVDWEAIVSDYHDLSLTGDLDVLSSTDKSGKLSIGTLSTDDYTFLLEALDTVGETNILSNPSIATLNNKEAKILVGSTQPYVTTTTTTPASGPTTTAETVNFIEVGVKLFVTPTIHKDGFITMKIRPEVSSVTSNLTTSNNNTIPIVETSEAETTVTVKDNVTIVIGGLIKEENIDSIKKIPFLGDLPVLGTVFRRESNTVTKTELVIFLTPKIVTGEVDQSLKR